MDSPSCDMNMSSICAALESTKIEVLSLQNENEKLNQQNYALNKKIEIIEKTTFELESELASNNDNKMKENLENKKLLSEIDSLNHKIRHLQSKLEEERIMFETTVQKHNEEKELGGAKKKSISADYEQINILTEQIQNLEAKLEEKEVTVTDLMQEKNILCGKNKDLISLISNMKEQLEANEQHLKQKTEDVNNLKESLESTREEKLLLSSELHMLKASDSHSARGNSLFAEVDENRQKVTAQRELLKMKYLNLKQVCNQKLAENNKLKLEIIKIRREDQDDEKETHQDYSRLIETYKRRISELEARVRSLEKPCDLPIPNCNGDNDNFTWVNTVVENARKETQSLQAELDQRGSNYVFQGHALFDSQKQNRKLKKIIAKLQSDIDELKQKIEAVEAAESEMKDGISPPAVEVVIDAMKKEKQNKKQKTVTFLAENVNTENSVLKTDHILQENAIKVEHEKDNDEAKKINSSNSDSKTYPECQENVLKVKPENVFNFENETHKENEPFVV